METKMQIGRKVTIALRQFAICIFQFSICILQSNRDLAIDVNDELLLGQRRISCTNPADLADVIRVY